LQEANPDDRVVTVDVYRDNALADQFVAADKYVIVTPMWNLGVPPMMKAYIDAIMAVGKTFRYTEKGPIGLLTNKKAVHIHARGGFYSEPPMKEFDFANRYIESVLRFMGVTEVHSVICEGHEHLPDKADEIFEAAIAKARELARAF